MSFANPNLLFLLILPLIISGLYYHFKLKRHQDLQIFAEANLLPQLTSLKGAKLNFFRFLLRLISMTFIIWALSGPLWGHAWQEVKQQGLEIVFALDTSKSMLATDIKPTRFQRAKLAIKDLVQNLQGDKVGLVAFAGTSFLQCPLTFDYNAFNISLNALNNQSIPRGGTAIAAAITTATKAFDSGESDNKILILITDGENHEGDPVVAATEAAKNGIHIYPIGIGSPEGELIAFKNTHGGLSYLKDSAGNVVKTALNEAVLKKIADSGKGLYRRAAGPSLGLEELYQNNLNQLTKTELKSRWQKRQINRFQWPLFLALLLIIFELFIGKVASHSREK